MVKAYYGQILSHLWLVDLLHLWLIVITIMVSITFMGDTGGMRAGMEMSARETL